MENTLQEKLLMELHGGVHLMHDMDEKKFKKLEKSHNQAQIMKTLQEAGGTLSGPELLERFETHSEDLPAVLEKLLAKGCITVEGEGESYTLTEVGRTRLNKRAELMAEVAAKILRDLSIAEQRQLLDLTGKVNANLRTQSVYSGYEYYLEDCWEPHGCVQPLSDMEERY